jgi:CRP/FNR family cyclic AMP-dependent transcriptional regulator
MRQSVETPNKDNEQSIGLDDAVFEKILAGLPLATCRAGETVLSAGSKTGRLLILKNGAVVILKDSIEIGRVEEPGAVFGELSALLDQPHTADVRALKDSEFFVADAVLLGKDPVTLLYVARILARRLVATNRGLVALKKQLQAGKPPGILIKMIDDIERIFRVGGSNLEQWL